MLTIAVISSEMEMEKPAEYVSIKFLLKQVYAAHTAKVRELELEVKDLKKQLEDAKSNIASSKSDCNRCKEMELAYSACKEYKNVVLEQTKKLREFEKLFSSIDKNKRCPETSPEVKNSTMSHKAIEEMVSESVNEAFLSEWDEITEQCEKAPVINCPENVGIQTSSQTLMPPPPTTLLADDIVLVPDTLDISSKSSLNSPRKTSAKTSPKKTPQKLSPKKIKQVSSVSISMHDKENTSISLNGAKNNKKPGISKKRTLNELNVNEVQAKKQHITKCIEPTLTSKEQDGEISISVLEHPVVVLETVSNSHDKKQKKTVVESNKVGGWAENFKDFNEDQSTKLNFSSAATTITTGKVTEVIDDDFQVKNSDENSTWKTSVKKNVKKPPPVKAVKCTSRFKMTLDAPNFDIKKPNLKQTKLSKSIFMPSKAAAKNEIIIIDNTNDKSDDTKLEVVNLDYMQNTASSATVSQLASLVDYNSCASPSNFEMPLVDVVSETVPQDSVACQSETFCPLILIEENNNPSNKNQGIEKESCENLDCKSSSKVVDECLLVADDECIDEENEEEEEKKEEVESKIAQVPCDSFDRLPVEEEPNYKYKEDPVRNKNKRKQLDAFNCKECEKYYTELGLSDEEKKKRMKECSRHRAKYVPPPTPDHFWELEFPDTAECKVRGYVAETQKVQLKSRRRRPLIDE